MYPRETLSLLRGPMTRDEIQRAREQRDEPREGGSVETVGAEG